MILFFVKRRSFSKKHLLITQNIFYAKKVDIFKRIFFSSENTDLFFSFHIGIILYIEEKEGYQHNHCLFLSSHII